MRTVSVIVPCFNEEEVLGAFYERSVAAAEAVTGWNHEWIFVNDCSTDRTAQTLDALAARDERVKVVHLARNRGHQVAVTAGLDYAMGDAVVIIDADLQDPPEVIGRMLNLIDEGYDVVHAQRAERRGETAFKLLTAKLFYSILRRIGNVRVVENAGDFRCVSRPVADTMRAFREPHRFLRGMFTHLGFMQCVLRYDRDERFAGESKYPFMKMLRLAADAVFSMSAAPIRAILWAAAGMWALGLGYLVYSLVKFVTVGIEEPGWTSVVFLLTMYTGLILASIAVIGQYVGRIFEQGQARPLYWVSAMRNIDPDDVRGKSVESKLARRVVVKGTAIASQTELKVFTAQRPADGWASAVRGDVAQTETTSA
jgi:dolichol-phosphate mannosyltransferase